MRTVEIGFGEFKGVITSGTVDELGLREWAEAYEARQNAILNSLYPPKAQRFYDDIRYIQQCLDEVSGLKEGRIFFSTSYYPARLYESDQTTSPPNWVWELHWKTGPRSELYGRQFRRHRSYQDVDLEDKASFTQFLDGVVENAAVVIKGLAENSGKRTFPVLTQPAEQIIAELKQIAAGLVDQYDKLFSPERAGDRIAQVTAPIKPAVS